MSDSSDEDSSDAGGGAVEVGTSSSSSSSPVVEGEGGAEGEDTDSEGVEQASGFTTNGEPEFKPKKVKPPGDTSPKLQSSQHLIHTTTSSHPYHTIRLICHHHYHYRYHRH